MTQGVEGWDVDLPTPLEANAIVHTVAKICWMVVYILVYGIRPLIIRPKPVGMADVINWGLVLAFDGVLLYTLGFKSLLYLVLGTLFGGGLHPIAGHLIQEHYMFVTVSFCHCYYLNSPFGVFTECLVSIKQPRYLSCWHDLLQAFSEAAFSQISLAFDACARL